MGTPRKFSIKSLVKYLSLGLMTLLALYPFLWMVLYSFKTNDEIFVSNPFGLPETFHFENYLRAFEAYDIFLYFRNSVLVSALTVLFTLIIAVMFSYAVARMTVKGIGFIRTYITAGMFIPVQIILIPLLVLVRNLGLANTFTSVIVPYVAFGLSFSSIILYGFFRSIPYAMEESAFMDGAGIFTTFTRIILPLVKPAMATIVILRFLSSWNEFTLALILISDNVKKTLPLGLMAFKGQFSTDWGAMGAAMTIASIPTLLLYLLFSDQVEKAMSGGIGIKG